MYLVLSSGLGKRLCQDNCWRSFANFGTYPECVKEYKSQGAAINKARRLRGFVLHLPAGFSMDAAGEVRDTSERKVLVSSLVVWPQVLNTSDFHGLVEFK